MSRNPRSAPSKRDRGGGNNGRVIAGNYRLEVVVPPIPEGKVRCPGCRNVATLTPTGRLRRHKDLFGQDCWNRVYQSEPLDEVPEVVLPPEPTPPTGPREKMPAPVVVHDAHPNLKRSPCGSCFSCGKPIPPMRRLCGKCMAGRRGS